MGYYTTPSNTTVVQGIPIGRLNNLEKRISTLESGGSGYQVPTGTVNGVNKVFVFTTAPTVVSVDGVCRRKTSSDSTVNWTGTTTITLTIAPNFDMFGLN